MREVIAFVAGALVVGFPLTILYIHAKESRDYFKRDRDDIYRIAKQLRQTLDERDIRAGQGSNP